jgi:AcrR family transcriptional regulator
MVAERAESPAEGARERILDAALDLFGERGLTGTTVRDIAARGKVNVAAISYHFGGKDELYRAVVESVVGSIAARVRGRVAHLIDRPPANAPAALAALEEFVGTLVDVIVGPPEMRRVARLIIREQMQPTPAFEILYAMLSQFHGAGTCLFAVAAGRDPDAEETKLRVFLLIGQVLVLRIAETAVLRRLGRDSYDDTFMSGAKKMIRQNVRAMVAAAEGKS